MADVIKEAFGRVRDDINDLKVQVSKALDRINDMAVDVEELKEKGKKKKVKKKKK